MNANINLRTVYNDSDTVEEKLEALREYVLSLKMWRYEDSMELQELKKQVAGIWTMNQLQKRAEQAESVYG